jgi:hypothetical protein
MKKYFFLSMLLFLYFLLIVIPIHEIGHLIGCYLTGAEVLDCDLFFRPHIHRLGGNDIIIKLMGVGVGYVTLLWIYFKNKSYFLFSTLAYLLLCSDDLSYVFNLNKLLFMYIINMLIVVYIIPRAYRYGLFIKEQSTPDAFFISIECSE